MNANALTTETLQTTWAYPAFEIRQRTGPAPTLVMFRAPAKDVLSFAEVGELGPKTRGPQREQKKARVMAITRFLGQPRNTIPTAVILAFSEGSAKFAVGQTAGTGDLSIDLTAGPKGSIVDGQHRLYGFQKANPDMEVAVVALLNADQVERAFQFLVINNKASKVPATHTKALLAKLRATGLAERLKNARLSFDEDGIKDVDLVNSDLDSPFHQSVDWPTTPKELRLVQATAIEQSLEYIGSVGVAEFDDRDIRRSVFLVMWKTIKAYWKDLWVVDSRLISKVGIVCLTRLIIDLIVSWSDNDELDIDLTDLQQIETQTRKIIEKMDRRFWIAPWAQSARGGFDTAQGRDRVVAALTQLFRNGRKDLAWYSDIDIVDPTAIET